MNKTPTHLLRALALTLLAACSADSSVSSNTGAASSALGSTDACWGATGSTSTPREVHTATLLPDGKVLVVGGARMVDPWVGDSVYYASAEVYAPASGTWSATASMSLARRSHTATLLPDGKVLVAGGSNDYYGSYASAEVYDAASGTWSATGSMATPRYVHTATLLSDGKVLAAGGVSDYGVSLGSAEVYDPATGAWSTTGSIATPRRGHSATLLPDGKVLIVGGNTGITYYASAEVYDPASGTWSVTGSMSVGRRDHTATLLPSGKVLVTGGYHYNASSVTSAELYDPATGLWSATGSMATPRRSHTATLLSNGKVLVTGGFGGSSGYLATTEVYDPATGTWSAASPMSVGRMGHSAVRLANDQVLVLAGRNGSYDYPLEAELYSCGVDDVATCPDGSPWSEVNFSSADLTLKLQCPQVMTLECGTSTWADPGATAADGAGPVEVHKYNTGDDDGDGIPDMPSSGPNMSIPDSYTMEYIAWNATGQVNVIRTVHVQDSTPPVLTLKGSATSTHTCGSNWVDPGVEATDVCDGDLTYSVATTGSVNGWAEGTYTLTYALTDSAGLSAPTLTRTVEVVDCPW